MAAEATETRTRGSRGTGISTVRTKLSNPRPPVSAVGAVSVAAASMLAVSEATRRRPAAGRRVPTVLRMVDTGALLAAAVACAFLLPEAMEGASIWMLAGLFGSWYVALDVAGARSFHSACSARAECAGIFRASLPLSGLLALVALLTAEPVHRDLLFVALPTGTLLLLVGRWLLRLFVEFRAPAGMRARRTVVVGRLAELGPTSVLQRGAFGRLYDVVGSMAADTASGTLSGDDPARATATGANRVLALCEEVHAEVVIVAGPLAADQELVRTLGWTLENSGSNLVLAPLPANIGRRRLKMVPIEGLPLVHVNPPTFRGGKYHVKRIFDVTAAAAALLLLAPLLIVVALVIRAEDGGPVLFRQQRTGIGGKPFTMFKFRTMCVDAESRLEGLRQLNEGNGVLFKLRDDPRVTHAGRWLRKFSIDELPQLFNVLGGSMSLVGPRPPLPSEVAGYTGYTGRRLLVRPGLTGLWQVSGRSDLGWEESVGLDLYYVENWSVGFDLEIIQRTVRVVLRPVGAY